MPKQKELASEKVYFELNSFVARKKLQRARQQLIPINKLFEQLLIQADLDYYKSRLENEIPM